MSPSSCSFRGIRMPGCPSRKGCIGLGMSGRFAGLRVGLKDIYDLEGVQTGGGSRSYAEVYPVSSKTAVSIQKLLDLGAVMIVSSVVGWISGTEC